MMYSEFTRTNCVLPTKKCETDIPISKGPVSPSIKRTHFSLTLYWTCAIHKV